MSSLLATGLDESLLEDNPFWDYSKRLYGAKGIQPICLDYQDNCDANVNLLLFCCWAGAQRRQLSAEEVASASELIHNWDLQVVQQIRQLRQLVKTVDVAEQAFANEQGEPDAPAFRDQILELELIAERIVQDSLYQWWQELPDYIGVDSGVAIIGNINSYLALLEADGVDAKHLLVKTALQTSLYDTGVGL